MLSAQSLAGRTSEAEALRREWSAWLLICACMAAWVGAAVSVQGEGGGEHGALVSVGGAGGELGGRAVVCLTPQGRVWLDVLGATSRGFMPTHAPWVRALHLPALPSMPPPGTTLGVGPVRVSAAGSDPALKHAVGCKPRLSPGLGAGSVICLNNNILRVHCRWSAPELDWGPRAWLLFTR